MSWEDALEEGWIVTVELLSVMVWVVDFFFAVPAGAVDFGGTVVGEGEPCVDVGEE